MPSQNEEMKTLPLPNGLVLTITDLTTVVSGDLYLVHLEVLCPVRIKPEYLASVPEKELQVFQSSTQGVVEYRRELTRRGVSERDVSRVKNEFYENFRQNSLPYLAEASFPGKFIQQRFNEWRKKRSSEFGVRK